MDIFLGLMKKDCNERVILMECFLKMNEVRIDGMGNETSET